MMTQTKKTIVMKSGPVRRDDIVDEKKEEAKEKSSEEISFPCDFCDFRSYSKERFKAHLENNHNNNNYGIKKSETTEDGLLS